MKFTISREVLLQPLSQVVGVVERRQTLPVLANFLLAARDGRLTVTGTDMEVELISSVPASVEQDGEITVPARKLLDIIKALPDGSSITVSVSDSKATISAGRSRFTLATLPASEFPATDQVETLENIVVSEVILKKMIDKTSFAMANQDVRYYLNGLLFDFTGQLLRSIATDGHRLAICDLETEININSDRQLFGSNRERLVVSEKRFDSTSRQVYEHLGQWRLNCGFVGFLDNFCCGLDERVTVSIFVP